MWFSIFRLKPSVDLRIGSTLGRIFLPVTNDESSIRQIDSAGDSLVISDRRNEMTAYALADGHRIGSTFGHFVTMSEAAGLICGQNDKTRLQCFDIHTMAPRGDVQLPMDVRLGRFSDDGRRLLVVTADQVVRVFDTAALAATASPAAAAPARP